MGRTRIQVEASQATQDVLTRLTTQEDFASSAAAVRSALHLLDYLILEQRQGARIYIQRPGEPMESLKFIF